MWDSRRRLSIRVSAETRLSVIPCFQLVYCRDISDYVHFAESLGSFLALRRRPFVIIDSNGPIPGLRGRYFENKAPKYFKGPNPPRLGDLAYTELPLFL